MRDNPVPGTLNALKRWAGTVENIEVRVWGRAGETRPLGSLRYEPEAAAPGAHAGEPRQSHRCVRVGVGGTRAGFSGCRGPPPAPPTVPRAPRRAHPTPAARGAPWLGQDARTQARAAAQRLAPPPPPRSGPLPAPCPLSAPTHRRRLRGKFGGAAAATARLLGARWRRGAQGADPEAGRRGRSRAEGAARGEAGRRRPGPRACRSPPPAPRAAAAPAPAGGARGATSLPPLPPRGPRGGPERPCLGPGSGARLLGWGASGERSPEAGRELPPPRAHLRARPEVSQPEEARSGRGGAAMPLGQGSHSRLTASDTSVPRPCRREGRRGAAETRADRQAPHPQRLHRDLERHRPPNPAPGLELHLSSPASCFSPAAQMSSSFKTQ